MFLFQSHFVELLVTRWPVFADTEDHWNKVSLYVVNALRIELLEVEQREERGLLGAAFTVNPDTPTTNFKSTKVVVHGQEENGVICKWL